MVVERLPHRAFPPVLGLASNPLGMTTSQAFQEGKGCQSLFQRRHRFIGFLWPSPFSSLDLSFV